MVRIQKCPHCWTVGIGKFAQEGIFEIVAVTPEILSIGSDEKGKFILVNCSVCYNLMDKSLAHESVEDHA